MGGRQGYTGYVKANSGDWTRLSANALAKMGALQQRCTFNLTFPCGSELGGSYDGRGCLTDTRPRYRQPRYTHRIPADALWRTPGVFSLPQLLQPPSSFVLGRLWFLLPQMLSASLPQPAMRRPGMGTKQTAENRAQTRRQNAKIKAGCAGSGVLRARQYRCLASWHRV